MNIPPGSLPNYSMLAVAVVGSLVYALRIFRMHLRGEFPLSGTLACVALAFAFVGLCDIGLEEWYASSVIFFIFAILVHGLIAEPLNIHIDPLYRTEVCILPLICIFVPLYMREPTSTFLFITTVMMFLIISVPSYIIYIFKCNETYSKKRKWSIILVSSAVDVFISYPFLVIIIHVSLSIIPHH